MGYFLVFHPNIPPPYTEHAQCNYSHSYFELTAEAAWKDDGQCLGYCVKESRVRNCIEWDTLLPLLFQIHFFFPLQDSGLNKAVIAPFTIEYQAGLLHPH
jgi:hypothetical protein